MIKNNQSVRIDTIEQKSGNKSIFASKLIVVIYFFSLAYSQWYYAGIQEGTLKGVVPKNATSIFVISLLFLLYTSLERLMVRTRTHEKTKMDLLTFFSLLFLFSTFLSIIIGIWKSGINFDTLEGLKSLSATLCGLALIRYFSSDIVFFLRTYMYVFGSIVVFSLLQLASGINWQTKNSFFTVGAESRWWDLYSVWGPFALSGKNVYGIILILSFALLGPITFLTSFFGKIERFISCIVLFLAAALIIISRSRTSLILLVVNLGILLLYLAISSKNSIPLVAVGLTLPLFAAFFLNKNSSWLLSMESSIARSNSLSAAMLAPDSNYLFGTGYNSIFQLTASTFGNSLSQAGSRGINIDNYFVRRTLEGGLLGFLSLIAIMFALASNSLVKNSSVNPSKVWRIVSLSLFIDIGFASATGDFLSFQLVNCYFFVIVGFISSGLRGVK